jgi:hypothetical protein
LADNGDVWRRYPGSLHADRVDANESGVIANAEKRRHVLDDSFISHHQREPAHPDELVKPDISGEKNPIVYFAMPAHQGAVHQHAVVSDLAVMRHVRVGHEVVMTADPRDAMARDLRATMDGHVLAKDVEIANLGSRRFATVGQMLRIAANDASRPDLIALSNDEGPDQVNVRSDPTVVLDCDGSFDDYVGPNVHVGPNVSVRRNNRRWMDLGCGSDGHGCPFLAGMPRSTSMQNSGLG